MYSLVEQTACGNIRRKSLVSARPNLREISALLINAIMLSSSFSRQQAVIVIA